jgi:hypothetical protein
MIDRVAARPAADRNFKPWVGELTYTYVANGEYYSGFHRIRARSERRAEDRISGWKGRTVVRAVFANQTRDLGASKKHQPGGQLGN